MHTSGLLLLLCSGIFVYLVWRLNATRKDKPSRHTVAILVLGDIGRSPRMMYHAESFAQNGFMTYLVGYGGLETHIMSMHPQLTISSLRVTSGTVLARGSACSTSVSPGNPQALDQIAVSPPCSSQSAAADSFHIRGTFVEYSPSTGVLDGPGWSLLLLLVL